MSEKSGRDAEIDQRLERLPSHLQGQMKKIWAGEEWEQLSHDERLRLMTWIWRLIESDVREALEAGTVGKRADSHTSRTLSIVDERGWIELNRIQNEALWATLAAKAESDERLAESGEEGFPVLSAMLCLEMGEGPPDAA